MASNKRIIAVVVMTVAVAAGSTTEKNNVSVGAIICLNDLEGNRHIGRSVTALDIERQNKHVSARGEIGNRRHRKIQLRMLKALCPKGRAIKELSLSHGF